MPPPPPPPIGFEKQITVEFFDDEKLPNAFTCSLILRLPRHLVEEEEFKQKMIFSILYRSMWFWKRLTCTFSVHYFNSGIICTICNSIRIM